MRIDHPVQFRERKLGLCRGDHRPQCDKDKHIGATGFVTGRKASFFALHFAKGAGTPLRQRWLANNIAYQAGIEWS